MYVCVFFLMFHRVEGKKLQRIGALLRRFFFLFPLRHRRLGRWKELRRKTIVE